MTNSIFGHPWEDIQAMQQGKPLAPVVSRPKPTATEQDEALLAEFGLSGLRDKQLYGVIDRLQTSGLISEDQGEKKPIPPLLVETMQSLLYGIRLGAEELKEYAKAMPKEYEVSDEMMDAVCGFCDDILENAANCKIEMKNL